MIRIPMAALPAALLSSCSTFSGATQADLASPYLGQTPPGSLPVSFAPGLVSSELFEYGAAFSPDRKEFYFIREVELDGPQEFVVFRYVDGQWEEHVLSERVGQPFIAPDGQTLHLGRRYQERMDDGWSEIKSLGPAFQELRIMRLTASSQGTYVFDEAGTDGDGIIRFSELIDGERQDPEALSAVINTGTWNAHPFIAPDESYILWDGRRHTGFGDSDIYVSFREGDGSWGEAINLGDQVNTRAWEASATVTPDGKYLFFHREVSDGNIDIMWVDAKVIWDLRP
ncbi:MAG: hypothetical protein AAF608_07640 [Pseudomonadota bacterium]